MTAKEYLESQLSIDCMGFDINDPYLKSALCAYAERISEEENGYSFTKLEFMLKKYLNDGYVRRCYTFVEDVYYYLNLKRSCPIDD